MRQTYNINGHKISAASKFQAQLAAKRLEAQVKAPNGVYKGHKHTDESYKVTNCGG